ncbi:MAG TPA: SCO1664 family protein [Nocardioides sp.]|uniref:SCO1664 family protein n=1 Tax=Nocardioides sp. TaxID=35761 RepID=UPI002E30B4D5|nr:SCO1664 family protein [Nocardioides sp.]HEX3931619.1 SCO1664 family protein [Nocardioides sp.]
MPEPELRHGELVLRGRVMPASNATFVGEIDGRRVVYKPVAGERPLWDFPDGTLAAREEAAYLVSEALGWGIVPLTFQRGGPHGPGMVQLWQEPDPVVEAVTLVPENAVPDGYLYVFEGLDDRDRVIVLVHEDTGPLRRMAVFDAVVNNADRKGGHVLAMSDGHRYGVDHGLTFHVEHKLRTVLWGWAGEALTDEDEACLDRLSGALEGDLGERLLGLVTPHEVEATRRRVKRLLRVRSLPEPGQGWRAIPWPPF